VLRVYQGLGGLASGAILYRARTPAQLALWGVVEGARTWQKHRRNHELLERPGQTAAAGFDATQLRRAAVVLEGYAAEAGLPKTSASVTTLGAEANSANLNFAAGLSQDLDALIARQAQRHTGWFTRWRYEILLATMLGWIFYRPAKNFFYDSWLASPPAPLYGPSLYAISAFWLILWCGLLLWAFTSRLRRGLRREIDELAQGWSNPRPAAGGIFVQLEEECRKVDAFRQGLSGLRQHVADLRTRLVVPEEPLGHRR
jgi:hypothetical protein